MLTEIKAASGLRVSIDPESIVGVAEEGTHAVLLTDSGPIAVHGKYEQWIDWYNTLTEQRLQFASKHKKGH